MLSVWCQLGNEGAGRGRSGADGSSAGKSFLPHVSRQKERRNSTIGPERWMLHSSQLSQLMLQLGRIACRRSMMMNLGCSTLKGR